MKFANLTKPIILNRLISKAIDLTLVLFLASLPQFSSFFYPLGPLAAFLYLLLGDGLMRGRSLGKRLLGLRVIHTPTGKPATFRESIQRNSTVAIPVLFFMVPLLGWLLWFLIGIPILAIEIALMTRLEQHARLGDTMADTEVRLDEEARQRV